MKDLMISSAEFLIFERQTHDKRIQVKFEQKDLWLTPMHINEIYSTYELEENSTSKKFLLVQTDENKKIKRKCSII